MTLDAKYNKYVEYFDCIRTIQNYIIKRSDKSKFPKIDNNNIDKSLGIIQDTILRALLDIYKKQNDKENKSSLLTQTSLLSSFEKVYSNLLNSKEALNLINQKVNKKFLFEKFFKNDNEIVSSESISPVKEAQLTKDSQLQFEINLQNLNNININNNIKQNNKKEYLSEPEQKNDKKIIIEDDNGKRRLNYQKTGGRNRSKKLYNTKVKSLSKVTYKKIFDKDNMNADETIENKSINSSILKGASVESDNERIKVINETQDDIDSISEVNDENYSDSVGSVIEGENNKEALENQVIEEN